MWRRGGPLAARGRAALHQHERLARSATDAHPFEERAAVGDAFDVGEADRGLVVVGEEVEVVGDGRHRGVAGRYGAADADAVAHGHSS